jgi:hypothetical protein
MSGMRSSSEVSDAREAPDPWCVGASLTSASTRGDADAVAGDGAVVAAAVARAVQRLFGLSTKNDDDDVGSGTQ